MSTLHGGKAEFFDALESRDLRDFVIEAQRRFGRRTLHNHASGLRTFFKFWMRRGRLKRVVNLLVFYVAYFSFVRKAARTRPKASTVHSSG